MIKLKISDNLEYQFDFDAVYNEKEYIYFKKVYKGKRWTKYQQLTIKKRDWADFVEFLQEIIKKYPPEESEKVPF